MNDNYFILEALCQCIEISAFQDGDRLLKNTQTFNLAKSLDATGRNFELDETALRELLLDIYRYKYRDGENQIEDTNEFRAAVLYFIDRPVSRNKALPLGMMREFS